MSSHAMETPAASAQTGAGVSRLVSLAASATEILFAIGAGDRLVGVSKYCDYPEQAQQKPRVGSFVDADYEGIQRVKPDIVLTQSHLQRDIVARLIDLNINVLSLNPVSLSGVLGMVIIIGKLVGCEGEAASLAAQMRSRIEAVRNRAASLVRRPRVYFEEWGTPLMSAGGWEAECVEVAGGTNVFPFPAHLHSRDRKVSHDDVIHANPELILVAWPGSSGRIRPYKIKQRIGWEAIEAVREDRVLVIDDRLIVRPGPRIVEGLELIANLIHRVAAGPADRAKGIMKFENCGD